MAEPLFMVEVDPEMQESDRDSLKATFQNNVQLQEQPNKQFLAGLIQFIAYAKDVGEVAGAASSLITLAQQIINWRKAHAPKAGKHAKVMLKRPGHKPLSLFEAAESEIVQWFQP
jgi:hypothetical protein